jgi:hypothetical protein
MSTKSDIGCSSRPRAFVIFRCRVIGENHGNASFRRLHEQCLSGPGSNHPLASALLTLTPKADIDVRQNDPIRLITSPLPRSRNNCEIRTHKKEIKGSSIGRETREQQCHEPGEEKTIEMLKFREPAVAFGKASRILLRTSDGHKQRGACSRFTFCQDILWQQLAEQHHAYQQHRQIIQLAYDRNECRN